VRICQLGVVLCHKYSFDGGSAVAWGHLRGRDAWAAAALAYAFGPEALSTAECVVKVGARSCLSFSGRAIEGRGVAGCGF
jgi:hypothetical protein